MHENQTINRENVTMKTTFPLKAARHPTEDEIAKLAYQFYEDCGAEPGRDWENWFAAKEVLENGSVETQTSRGPAPLQAPTDVT